MRVLGAWEYSGAVRDAFIAKGHDAFSCDLLPTETEGPHIHGDVNMILGYSWDLVIAHPPCTRLCNSGVRWLHERNLWDEMRVAAQFFLNCLNANSPKVAVENPIMHKYALDIVGRGPDFSCQPYDFGDAATKRTCFWIRGLYPLKPTSSHQHDFFLDQTEVIAKEDIKAEVHHMPPSEDRWKLRSTTYPGIAYAMAEQWG